MQKFTITVLLVSILTFCLATPVYAGGFFNRKTFQTIGLAVVVERIAESEQNRNRRHDVANRNSNDLKRNRAEIEMKKERDQYARDKQMADLRFKQELERERELQKEERLHPASRYGDEGCELDDEFGVIILCDPKGRYKVDEYDEIFTSAKAVKQYVKSLFPDRKVAMFWQKVADLETPLNTY
ncbi:MAG TPA: hypothetical protein P5056_00345 [Candidatus Paceibacterota bacterium]|nr:hypothetical protein [Candidatus Paceibacterota bacterium]